uniref:Uncharacterized protein n=1 Tax=Ascaris lumbricoides TaxID=6252 RepID=A0A0M3I5U2_ASCLU
MPEQIRGSAAASSPGVTAESCRRSSHPCERDPICWSPFSISVINCSPL